jgi:hypothetical protein
VLDDLRPVLGVFDEAEPQAVAVVDVLLGQRLGGPQRRAVNQAQSPPAALRGFQSRKAQLPQTDVDDLQQRVHHHRNRGIGVQQNADLYALAGDDADHGRLRRRNRLSARLWRLRLSYCGHRSTPLSTNCGSIYLASLFGITTSRRNC